MNIGDKVRVVKLPNTLPDDELGTKLLFERCLNRTFSIVGLKDHLLEIEVGAVVGEPDYMHSIWIERELVEIAN
jgi:hypothetical protein